MYKETVSAPTSNRGQFQGLIFLIASQTCACSLAGSGSLFYNAQWENC